jgi:hypothetical protein
MDGGNTRGEGHRLSSSASDASVRLWTLRGAARIGQESATDRRVAACVRSDHPYRVLAYERGA